MSIGALKTNQQATGSYSSRSDWDTAEEASFPQGRGGYDTAGIKKPDPDSSGSPTPRPSRNLRAF